jgi:hypothetical protein
MPDATPTAALPNTQLLRRPPRQNSCALCHRRKVRCDKDPCTNCEKHGVPCVPMTPSVARPRKKRFPEAELLARLKRYEEVLKSYGANLDSINSGILPSPGSVKSPWGGNSSISSPPPTKEEQDTYHPSTENEVGPGRAHPHSCTN